MFDLYEILDNSFNYYNYQPGSNNIIVYGKHITHVRMYARTHAHTRIHAHTRAHAYVYPPTAVTIQVVAVPWVGVRSTMTKIRPLIIIIINFIYTLFPEKKLCSRVFTTGTLIIQTKNIINDAKS